MVLASLLVVAWVVVVDVVVLLVRVLLVEACKEMEDVATSVLVEVDQEVVWLAEVAVVVLSLLHKRVIVS